METVEASGKTIEVMVMEQSAAGPRLRVLSEAEVDACVKELEEEAAAAEASRKTQPPAADA